MTGPARCVGREASLHATLTLRASLASGRTNRPFPLRTSTSKHVHMLLHCIMLAALLLEQVWDTQTGEELYTLEGHKNVVRQALL